MDERAPRRPFIFVLAGVNGAGKSSVGGAILRAYGIDWFNPDAYAREFMRRSGGDKGTADSAAWNYGKMQLEAAIGNGTNFAFETTLGGNTIPCLLERAAATHDVMMIFCGLASVQMHIDRVRLRVRCGGHDIPEDRIRKRWDSSRENLVRLLPRLAQLQVFDNSVEVSPGDDIPPPTLLLKMEGGRVSYPDRDDAAALRSALGATPDWAKPILAAALRCHDA